MRASLPCFCRMDGRVDGVYFADTFWLEAVRNGKIRNDTLTCPHLHCYSARSAHIHWEVSVLHRRLLAPIVTIGGHWRALAQANGSNLRLAGRTTLCNLREVSRFKTVIPDGTTTTTFQYQFGTSMSTDPGFFWIRTLFLSRTSILKCLPI